MLSNSIIMRRASSNLGRFKRHRDDLCGTLCCQSAHAAVAVDLEMPSEGFCTWIDDRCRILL